MRVAPMLLAFCVLCACGPKPITSRSNVYKVGISTESDMITANGQPLSRTVAVDGTITDIYPMDGTVFADPLPAGAAGRQAELVWQHHYVYSPDGILRHVILDMPSIGPKGDIVHNLTDMATVKVSVKPGWSPH